MHTHGWKEVHPLSPNVVANVGKRLEFLALPDDGPIPIELRFIPDHTHHRQLLAHVLA
jgi:hypothetical protein